MRLFSILNIFEPKSATLQCEYPYSYTEKGLFKDRGIKCHSVEDGCNKLKAKGYKQVSSSGTVRRFER